MGARPSVVQLAQSATTSARPRSSHKLTPVNPRWPTAPGAFLPRYLPADELRQEGVSQPSARSEPGVAPSLNAARLQSPRGAIRSAPFELLEDGLAATREPHGSLLDTTMVLYGTNMGSANSHANDNLPVVLAGGGFKHGQHLAFDRKKNYPLTNLHVSMLQRLGLEVTAFSSGTGTMKGL